MIRGLMTDDEWAIVAPFLDHPLRCVAGARQPTIGGCWMVFLDQPHWRTWRDLPEAFGNWNSIWRQFRRWCESGVWDVLLQGLADGGGELDALQMIDSTTIRAHRCAAGETGGMQFQALGRSRGGFTTKVHLRCNAAGLPVGVVLTAGEAHDVTAYDALMQQAELSVRHASCPQLAYRIHPAGVIEDLRVGR